MGQNSNICSKTIKLEIDGKDIIEKVKTPEKQHLLNIDEKVNTSKQEIISNSSQKEKNVDCAAIEVVNAKKVYNEIPFCKLQS